MKKKGFAYPALVTIVFLLAVGGHLALACDSMIVNLDASITTRQYPVKLYFEAGTYLVEPIGIAEGGLYNAWSPRDGWVSRYGYSSKELGDITSPDRAVYETAQQALRNAPSMSFTIQEPGWVDFYTPDNQNTGDKLGGMSLRITPPADCVIVNVSARNRTKSDARLVHFPAGQYEVTPIGSADGGIFNAWHSGLGWVNRYNFTSVEFADRQVWDGVRHRTAEAALASARDAVFTLQYPRYVQFWIQDGYYPDNTGGMSLMVCRTRPSAPATHPGTTGGWKRSFQPALLDDSCTLAGGTEILHLVSHKARLYAANGYWMDTVGYANIPWAQILVLDSPTGRWKVDLEMGPRHLRATALESVRFERDGHGTALPEPVDLLLAASDYNPTGRLPGNRVTSVWTRDDENDTWVKTTLQSGPSLRRSTRAFFVHRDQVTGVDRVFAAAGALGVYSGVYDPDLAGKIRWDKSPELGPVSIRPMSFAEANGRLYVSIGSRIYRRTDGLKPRWLKVYSNNTQEHWELGGIRGLTTIPSPGGQGESLLFSHTNRIIRLDPKNGHRARVELWLGSFLGRSWGRSVTGGIIAAYNDMLPITNPLTGETVHIIGVQGRVSSGTTFHGWYPGGSYILRDADGRYRLKEVDGRWRPGKSKLVSTRTYTVSPFPEEEGKVVYLGGFDANFRAAHNTAWIFRAPIETVLGAGP